MKATILLVDDLADSLSLLSKMLSRHLPGCQILTAMSGGEGLSIAQHNDLDLILLDARMPIMDGFEVCRRLKTDPKTAIVPVLMVSGVLVESRDRIAGLETGADGYICKPFEPEELIAQVKALLRVKRAEDELRRRERDLEKELATRTRNLIDSEQRFRAVFERSPDSIFVEDAQGLVIDVNPAACEMHGMTREQLIGRPVTELVPADLREQVAREFPKWFTGEVRQKESQSLTRSGRVLHVDLRANRINYNGKQAIILLVRDITDRHDAQQALLVSEARFRAIVEDQTEFITRWTPDGKITYANEPLCRFMDRPRDRLLGWNFLGALSAEEHARLSQQVQGLSPASPIAQNESAVKWSDGSLHIAHWINRGIFDAAGRLVEVQSTGRDVTEQRHMESALRQSEERYRALVEDQTDMICRLTPEGAIIFGNRAYCDFIGRRESQLSGLSVYALLPEGERARMRAHLAGLNPAQPVQQIEHLAMDAGGSSHWQQWINRGIFSEDGRLIEIHSSGRDVTQQKAVQELQTRSSLWLRAVVEIADDLLACPDIDSLFRQAVELSRSRLGLERSGIMLEESGYGRNYYGTNLKGETTDERSHITPMSEGLRERFRLKNPDESRWSLVEEEYREWRDGELVKTGRTGPIAITPIQTASKALGLFFNDNALTGTPIDKAKQEIVSVFCSMLGNIAERKVAESERAHLAAAVEQSAEMVIITDRQGTIQYVNPGFERATGYARTEAVGRSADFLSGGGHDPLSFTNLARSVADGGVWTGRIVNRRKDGAYFETETTISPVRDGLGKLVSFLFLSLDVTRTVQMEAELRQAQKMESVGRLAGGIAHDFNNLLTAILGFARLTQGSVAPDSSAHADIQEIINAGERAAKLTKQLLAFGRKQMLQMHPLDPNAVVINMDQILRRTLGEDIELVTMCAEDVGSIEADAGLLEQVIMNLAVNARDAMPRGGKLTISTSCLYLNELYCSKRVGMAPGDYVLLSVKDNGHGMPDYVREHAFEPFFTTKDKGKGSGLGLSTVYGIVKQCHGHIDLISAVGQGTEFRIMFPRSLSQAHVPPPAARGFIPHGTETILLVEDEGTVRRLARRNLESLGYKILEARNGEDALRIYKSATEPIHLVLSDVIMPCMGGPELVENLRGINPDVKVLYVSGFTEDIMLDRVHVAHAASLLLKPYTLETLAQTVRQVLDE